MTRVLIAGLGNMGLSHALAHHALGSDIVGLVNRSDVDLPEALQGYPRFRTFEEGLATNVERLTRSDGFCYHTHTLR